MSSNISIKRICVYCGAAFEAKTTVTRFCSKSCNGKYYKNNYRAVKINQSNIETNAIKENQFTELKTVQYKDVLTVSEAALYLSVSRQTIYNWLNSGVIYGRRMTNRKVLFFKYQLIELFESKQAYEKPTPKKKMPITDFYTIDEIKQKFNVGNTWIFKIIKENRIPKTMNNGKTYVSKKHIDKYFTEKDKDVKYIKEWYTVEELINKYGLSKDQIYGRVNRFNIPKMKVGKFSKISKAHFDQHHSIKIE